jgi:hypothetical protein
MPFPPAKVAAAAIKRWLLLLAAVLALGIALAYTPRSYTQIEEVRALRERGQLVQGVIVSYRLLTGRNRCSSSVLVEYSVQKVAHFLRAHGCGASPEMKPIGTPVDVIYLPESPATSETTMPGLSVPRASWALVFTMWSVAAGLSLTAFLVWSRTNGSPRLQNAP